MTDFNIYDKNGNGGSIAAMARTVVESMIADGSLPTGGSVDPDDVVRAGHVSHFPYPIKDVLVVCHGVSPLFINCYFFNK